MGPPTRAPVRAVGQVADLPGSNFGRSATCPTAAALLLAAAWALAPAGIAGPPAADDVPPDVLLTVAARRALLADRDLAHLPLGVSVRQRTAVLWGSSPSAALTARAVERLRHVPGLTGVRSEVLPVPAALAEAGRPEEPPAGDPPTPVASPLAPGALAGQAGPPGRAPGLAASASSVPAGAGPDAAVILSAPVAVAAPVAGPACTPAAELLRPILRPVSPAPAPPAPSPAAAVPDLTAAVERLRRGDERFGQLRAEVQGRAVIVRGTARCGEDVTAFARALARVGGVERVVLDQVQVGPRP
jgi:hypothetical protein